MSRKRRRKELRSAEEFERALREEISMSGEFGLPLSVLILRMEGGFGRDGAGRVLDTLRTADLIAASGAEEVMIALPNTGPEGAKAVERRLSRAVPEATVGVAVHRAGEGAKDLIRRARKGL